MTTNVTPNVERPSRGTRPQRPSGNRKGKGKPKTDTTKLKVSLVIGSVLATFMGGELLANQDFSSQAAELPQTNPVVIQQADGSEWVISEAPIAQLVIPDPVTNSRSSG